MLTKTSYSNEESFRAGDVSGGEEKRGKGGDWGAL
jgi:hypothetical protein